MPWKACALAAAALGWKLSVIDGIGAATMSQLLGLDRDGDYGTAEREHPELLALVSPNDLIEEGSSTQPAYSRDGQM